MIRTLIIDDEPLARQLIRTFLADDKEVEIIGECENGFDGFKMINELKPDLIFLDIMMPKLTGFEMLELLDDQPAVIFSTAYDEYAIKAFEQNALDYLLKPYSKDRLGEALTKAKRNLVSQTSEPVKGRIEVEPGEKLNRVAVRNGSKIHILGTDSIQYLEAMDDYVKIHASEGSFLKQQTMKYFENHLSEHDFLRIHRSFIVQLRQVIKLEPMGKDTHAAILKDGTSLSVSRAGYARLKEVLKF